ncbi:hypothetical protein AYO47_07955 [Planctomyces sp. SCGC AG-212-M04]|nr:hypothetical protein AYO47_07955 [Planctomyces sp. SCGC AG-212-M04]
MIGGMTDNTPKPKRKRLQWFIAGVLLLAGFTWSFWPRVDHRFVGKWTVGFPNNPSTRIVQLGASGWAREWSSPGVYWADYRWQVGEGRLSLAESSGHSHLRPWVRWLTGANWSDLPLGSSKVGRKEFVIRSFDGNTIELEMWQDVPPTQVQFKRLSE